ncbi:MAG: SOS response-associated peptidase [Deltaproteobacteria bacterium]|nr:SOS response-associated peptidase [Deltaproteobacteria bacterium]
MCGRFVRSSPAEAIAEQFGVALPSSVDLRPRYNLSPGERIAAIVAHASERRLGELRWGLGRRGTINVRAESASSHPSFREAFRRRRCLIPADGFYEWRREGSAKVPFFFRLRSHRPLAFAGLWNRDPPAEPAAAAILTCPANALVAAVHDRMPVILGADQCDRWLDPTADRSPLEDLLRPLPADQLEAYRVSTLVNSARNDSPECIRPADRPLRLMPSSG